MNKNKVIVIGSTNVDKFLNVKRFPKPGEDVILIKLKRSLVGQGANQAIAASRLAADTTFISKIGKMAMLTLYWKISKSRYSYTIYFNVRK